MAERKEMGRTSNFAHVVGVLSVLACCPLPKQVRHLYSVPSLSWLPVGRYSPVAVTTSLKPEEEPTAFTYVMNGRFVTVQVIVCDYDKDKTLALGGNEKSYLTLVAENVTGPGTYPIAPYSTVGVDNSYVEPVLSGSIQVKMLNTATRKASGTFFCTGRDAKVTNGIFTNVPLRP